MKTKNHFVSKCYLEMWENSNRNIQVYKKLITDKNEALWREKKSSQIGYLNNFYIVYDGESKDDNEQYSDKFEDIFNNTYENRLKKILKKIDDEKELENAEWTTIFKFISVQRFKTIDGFLRIKEISSKKFEKTIKSAVNKINKEIRAGTSLTHSLENKSDLKLPIFIESRIVRERHLDLKIVYINGRSVWLNCLDRLINSHYKFLQKHTWSLVKAPLNKEWITSDNPVITLNYYNIDNYDFKGGLNSLNSNIIVPLSPKFLLFTQIGVKMPLVWGASIDFYELIIKLICENATVSIFCRNKNNLVNKYVDRNVDKSAHEYYLNLGKYLFEDYKEKEVSILKKYCEKE